MDDWEKFNEKEEVQSHLNMEDITDADYAQVLRNNKNQENIIICMFKAIHYCQLMYLRALEICVLKYTNLIMQNFFELQDQHGKYP